MPDFQEDLPLVIQRAREAGVERIINVGVDTQSTLQALDLATQTPWFSAAAGWHPHNAVKCQPADLDRLRQLARLPKIIALGEIGLDFYYLHSPQNVQEDLFHTLLDLASEVKLPVIIHTREAFASTVSILKQHRAKLPKVLIHCFTGSWDEAKVYLDLDCHLSIPGVLTFPKALPVRQALPKIPADRLLMETDGPYLAPVPKRGRRNEPAFLVYLLMTMAEILDKTPDEIAGFTYKNTLDFFNLNAEKIVV
jgi:TatD DNase family protein